jgi:exonuclease VII small subunit
MAEDRFLEDLVSRLGEYGAELERSVLPGFKSNIQNLKSTYDSLIGLLKKKGLLSDDPYQYSEKISEIKPVANEPFPDSQKQSVVSIRMHNFESQLAFLAEYYQFSLDYLTLGRLKAITQLLRYVKWEGMSETAAEQNTKLVAELVGRVRKGDDSISAGLVNDMVNQMNTNSTKVFELLKKVTFFKREEYKLLLRNTFWNAMNLAQEEVSGNPDNVQRKIKKEFAAALKGQPYIPELIKELLDEDFAVNSAAVREELLTKLRVTRAVQAKPKTTSDPRVELMEAVRVLGSSNLPLDAALRKLSDNASLLEVSHDSLGERFQAWIRKLMGIKNKPRLFVIDLFDPATGATKRDPLEFDPFLAENSTRVRLLAGVSNRNGPSFASLSQKSEDEILAWFERQFIDLAKTVERINGLDVYFKTEVPKEKRPQVKGVKAEVAQIRTSIGNANKARHEAVGRREEQEQLKRLGIKS